MKEDSIDKKSNFINNLIKMFKKANFNWGMLSEYRNVIYGIATISVILFHFAEDIHEKDSFKGMITHIYENVIGSIGVEIFILMSGICMYFSYHKKQNIKEFYIKRFRRLIIPFVLVVVPFYFYRDIIMSSLGIKRFLYDVSYASFFKDGVISVWYILCIAIMYFLYPFIFKSFEKYDKKRELVLCIYLGATVFFNALLYVCCPQLFYNIEIMTMRFHIYFIGVYLGKKVYEKTKITDFEVGLFMMGILVKLSIDLIKFAGMIKVPRFFIRYFSLNSSFVILGIITVILVIFKVNSKNKFLTKCGLLSLEIYLVHVTLRNILTSNGYPITRYSYFFIFLIASIVLSILVNKLTNLIEHLIIRR